MGEVRLVALQRSIWTQSLPAVHRSKDRLMSTSPLSIESPELNSFAEGLNDVEAMGCSGEAGVQLT